MTVKNLKAGKEVEIISYNETLLKEILLDGISVISTDHTKMGETAARLTLSNSTEKSQNPFRTDPETLDVVHSGYQSLLSRIL